MNQKARILLVEDDANLGMLVEEYLGILGYQTTLASDGEEGLNAFTNQVFDLCILDVMLPKKDGFTLAYEIRQLKSDVPVIFLTARGQNEDKVAGFKAGCDDYITKPFSSEELALRIEAILKRCGLRSTRHESVQYSIGRFIFDTYNHLLTIDGYSQKLTTKEAGILKLFCENPNQLIKREVVQKAVWGTSDYFVSRSMDVFINKLRKYLSKDAGISIQNIHGAGFKLEIKEPHDH